MDNRLDQLIQAVAPERNVLLSHPIYHDLNSLEDFKTFMEYHVFAVWDFMSLLKSLQIKLTGISLPWMPAADPMIARLINDIVLAEETDDDGKGGFCSHFELYIRAMKEAGADTTQIDQLLIALQSGEPIEEAMNRLDLPDFIQKFVLTNYRMALYGKPHEVAASFTLGREDLIPDLFRQLVDELVKSEPDGLATLAYYFDRHIHLDEEEHGPLAWRMVELLIDGDAGKSSEAEVAAREALEVRKLLWDGIHQKIAANKHQLS
jgi:hypothetical protein